MYVRLTLVLVCEDKGTYCTLTAYGVAVLWCTTWREGAHFGGSAPNVPRKCARMAPPIGILLGPKTAQRSTSLVPGLVPDLVPAWFGRTRGQALAVLQTSPNQPQTRSPFAPNQTLGVRTAVRPVYTRSGVWVGPTTDRPTDLLACLRAFHTPTIDGSIFIH